MGEKERCHICFNKLEYCMCQSNEAFLNIMHAEYTSNEVREIYRKAIAKMHHPSSMSDND